MPVDLEKRLNEARETGYAVNHGERNSAICGAAAAFFNADGHPVGVLSLMAQSLPPTSSVSMSGESQTREPPPVLHTNWVADIRVTRSLEHRHALLYSFDRVKAIDCESLSRCAERLHSSSANDQTCHRPDDAGAFASDLCGACCTGEDACVTSRSISG